MKTLVAGWFSFQNGHATAGDLLSRDLACDWLDRCQLRYDVALAPPFVGGVDLEKIDPQSYSQVLFVCGPFQRGELEARMFDRFDHCRWIGLNLSMELPVEQWNPFDLLIERDSSKGANPDMVFLSPSHRVPVVGVCLVERYPGALVDQANAAVQRLTTSRHMAVVPIDTRLDLNTVGLRNPEEIESLIARMEVLVTTRLHGMVLALKNGVPVIAIDPMAGGAKIQRQARTIGWPIAFAADTMTDTALRESLDYCLSDAARDEACRCGRRAAEQVEAMRDRFVQSLREPANIERRFQERRASPGDKGWISAHLAKVNPAPPPPKARPSLAQRIARLLERRRF
jgi:hypothetical protein